METRAHSSERRQTTLTTIPRLRFDLLAQRSIGSTKIKSLGGNCFDRVQGQHSHFDGDDTLPALNASTAREFGAFNPEDTQRSRDELPGRFQTARIRYAPPASTPLQSSKAKKVPYPPPASKPSSNQLMMTHSHLEHDDTSFTVQRQLLAEKQVITARCFQVLYELQRQNQSGSAKALLHQIYTVLLAAAYNCEDYTTSSGGIGSSPEADESSSSTSSSISPSELICREYFVMLAYAQETLYGLEKQEAQLQTKVDMEQAIERDLTQRLQQLDGDVDQLRSMHATNDELIEMERTAVAQLEQEYAMLLTHQHEAKHECDVLTVQAEKQKLQLKDIRTKSAYLEFVSRIPMKKHLEEKKIRDQEEGLLLKVRQVDDENALLETELARLNKQVEDLEQQYQQDFNKKAGLELALRDAEEEWGRMENVCRRTRGCHTPRPLWDAIVDQTPELSHQKYHWEIVEDTMDDEPSRGYGDVDRVGDGSTIVEQPLHSSESGRTKKLVKEMLHWMERLQKHCGVNLHLSRIWHDIEEARVELNILHHQLDRAARRGQKHPSGGSGSQSSGQSSPKKMKQEFVVALGNHEDIPKFLRHQGKIKQRYLKKGELETLIRKVWTEKRKREQRNPHVSIPLEDVLYEKLHRKYGFQPLIAEWGYNILLALSSFNWDAEIEMFLLCLTNAISDQVYVDQEQMIASCQQMLGKLSESYGNESFTTERRVLFKDALVTLRKFYPLKTSVQLQAIEKAIIRDMHKMKRGGNDSILYIDDILPLQVNYPKGFFVKTIRTQHFKEIQDFYALVISELGQRDTKQSGQLPLSEIKEAIFTIDPLADSTTVYTALVKGVGVKSRTHLKMHDVVDYKAVLKKINAVCLMKFTLNFDPHAEMNWQRQMKGSSGNSISTSD